MMMEVNLKEKKDGGVNFLESVFGQSAGWFLKII